MSNISVSLSREDAETYLHALGHQIAEQKVADAAARARGEDASDRFVLIMTDVYRQLDAKLKAPPVSPAASRVYCSEAGCTNLRAGFSMHCWVHSRTNLG